MPDNSLEITVKDGFKKEPAVTEVPAKITTPTSKNLPQWVQERLAEDAKELYGDFREAIKTHLKPRTNKDGEAIMPNTNVMGMVADILKLRDPGGININQNFGGNTTNINTNGAGLSFEELVRRQGTRDRPREETIIDAEVIEPEEKK